MTEEKDYDALYGKELKEDFIAISSIRQKPITLESHRQAHAIVGRRKPVNEDIQQEVERLERKLGFLRFIQHQSLHVSALAEDVVAPINTLPSEMLRMVLEFACGHLVNEFQKPREATRLRLVCKRWNEELVADIYIWSSISLGAMMSNSLMAKSLELSREMRLIIDILEDFPNPFEDDASPASTLLAHSSRWRDVRIHGDVGWRHFRRATSYPSLVSLRLENISEIVWDFTAPYLVSLSIDSSLADLGASFSWGQLCCLTFSPTRDADIRSLASCTNLDRVELAIDSSRTFSGDGSTALVTLLNVKVLVIRMYRSNQYRHIPLGAFIDKLVFPGLVQLSIFDENYNVPSDDSIIPAARTLVQRSTCSLQLLQIEHVHSLSYELLQLLRSQPSIVYLQIHDPSPKIVTSSDYSFPVSDILLAGLDPCLPNTFFNPLLPNLKLLWMTVCPVTSSHEPFINAFVKMVECRRSGYNRDVAVVSSVHLDIVERYTPQASEGWGPGSVVHNDSNGGWGTGVDTQGKSDTSGAPQSDMKAKWVAALSRLKKFVGLNIEIIYEGHDLSL